MNVFLIFSKHHYSLHFLTADSFFSICAIILKEVKKVNYRNAKNKAKEWMLKERQLLIILGILWFFVTLSFVSVILDPTMQQVYLSIMDAPILKVPMNSANWLMTKVFMITTIYTILIQYPFEYGFTAAYYNLLKEKKDNKYIISGFKDGYNRIISTLLIRDLLIALGSFLLIIPGVILSCSLRFVPFLLKDHPEMSQIEIIKESFRLSKGYRMQIFMLDLSFAGWQLLSAIGLTIIQVYWIPYKKMADAELYHAAKRMNYQ